MKIACLGWGSLIWQPKNLLIQNKWFEDGAILPIEFTRQSDNGRMTLIIDEKALPVRTLWALMATDDLQIAIESLRIREDTPDLDLIHSVKVSNRPKDATRKTIVKWLKSLNLAAAIWTGLSFSGHTGNNRPRIDDVITHLNNLLGNNKDLAEEYIRKAPKQIDTEYRRRIEKEFGWTFIE